MQSLADLHIHTTFSDGLHTPARVLAVASRRGMDIVAITDHDTIEGALEAQKIADYDSTLPRVIVGEEVTSRDGHILGLYLRKRIAPGMPAQKTVDAIHAQGGIAIAAHPFWRAGRHGVGEGILRSVNFDGIEEQNGVPGMWRSNLRAFEFNQQARIAATGGSDAHSAYSVGWAHTLFEGTTPEHLRSELLAARTAPAGCRRRVMDVTLLASGIIAKRGWRLFALAA